MAGQYGKGFGNGSGNGNGHGRYRNGNGGRNGNGNGHGNGHGPEDDPRLSKLRDLYRLKSTRERRARLTGRKDYKTPALIGTGLLMSFVGLTCIGVLLAMQLTVNAFAALTRDLPSPSKINEHSTFKTAQIFDRKGTLLWEFYSPDGGRRTIIPLSEVSQHLIDATLAAEDAYYYQHQGFDARATLRSAIISSSGESRTGASTITQQLVRNVLMDPREAREVSVTRKIREIILAYQLTQKLSKDQILEMYLNEVYYGNLSYGIEAAAQSYFDKHARDLDLAESALLAGLVQSPSRYDPTRRDVARTSDGIPIETKERQAYVLEQMTKHGFITEQQARDAYDQKLTIKERRVDLKSPHWVMYVRDQVERKYGPKFLYQGGLRIYTSLDHDYNERMREVLWNSKANIDALGGTNAALIAANPRTGEILSFNGSMDYNDASIDGQVNVLTNERQPGSSIKPLIYAASFAKGWAPGTFVDDNPTCWQDRPGNQWCPVNFDKRFHGQTTVRSALGNSLNIPAVKALEYAGIDPSMDLGRAMGITSWEPDTGKHFGLSLTLGGAEVRPIDLAQMYTTFANNGLKVPLVSITRIVDAEGNVIEDYKVPQGEQVLDPRVSYMISHILADPAAKLFTYGANTPLVLKDRVSASKTGTTDNYKDTWTAGYTPNLAIVVWVGNSDGRPMREVLSSMTAGKIWPEAMTASFDFLKLPPEDFVRPDGLVEQQVCGDTTMRPGAPACRMDLFLAERAPRGPVGVPPAARPTGVPTPGAPVPGAPAPKPQLPSIQPQPTAAPKPQVQPQPQPTAAPKPAAPTPTPAAKPQPAPKPGGVAPAPAPTPTPTR